MMEVVISLVCTVVALDIEVYRVLSMHLNAKMANERDG